MLANPSPLLRSFASLTMTAVAVVITSNMQLSTIALLLLSLSLQLVKAEVYYWYGEGNTAPAWTTSESSNCKTFKECGRCNDGWFVDSSYYKYCTACPSGKSSSDHIAVSDACPADVIADATCQENDCESHCHTLTSTPIVSCESCPAGKYSPGGREHCVVCPSGKYSDAESDNCESCPEGKYIPVTATEASGHSGPGSCLECRGETALCESFWGTEECSACNSCEVGKYYDSSSDDCDVCPVGKYAGTPGQTRCDACERGKYNQDYFFLEAHLHDSEADCHSCEPGKFQPDKAASSCNTCPSGKFSQSGQAGCQGCPDGTTSSNGSDECEAEGTGILTGEQSYASNETPFHRTLALTPPSPAPPPQTISTGTMGSGTKTLHSGTHSTTSAPSTPSALSATNGATTTTLLVPSAKSTRSPR